MAKSKKTLEITQTKTKANRQEIQINDMDYTTSAEPKAFADGRPVFCAHDKIVPIKELRENPLNPNKHPDDQIRALAAIIKATGWRQPITVSTRSGLIVKGHGRLAAAKYGKFKEAPVDYQNYASEEEELADLMADNRIAELAEIDSVKLAEAFEAVDTGAIPFEMTGYEESFYQELATALCEADHDKEEADDDTVLPPPEEPVSKLGDVWILGRHRLMCGNSTNTKDREELLAGAEPELMLTDPPYCSGGHQESGKSTGSIGTVRKGQTDAPKIANDILSTRGYIKLLTAAFEGITPLFAYVFTDWRMWIYLYDIIEKSGFGVRSMIVWDKETPGMGVGWRSQHELCLFGSRGKAKFDGHKGYGNVLRCSRSGNELHPTQKPVELMEMILDNMDFVKTMHRAEDVEAITTDLVFNIRSMLMATLKAQKQEIPFSKIEMATDTCVKLTALVSNAELSAGYYVNEIGIYAVDELHPAAAPVLYSIAIANVADYLPPYNGLTPSTITQEYFATVDNALEVTIQTKTGAVALAEDLEATNEELARAMSDKAKAENEIKLDTIRRQKELEQSKKQNTEPGEYDPGSNYEGGTP